MQWGYLVLSIAFALAITRSAGWRNGRMLVPLAIGELAAVAALILNYVGKSFWAARIGAFGVLVALAFMVTGSNDGFHSIAMVCFPGLIVVAVMMLGKVDYLVLAFATLLTATGLGVAEIQGVIPTVPLRQTRTDYFTVFFVDLALGVIATFGGLLARDARLNLAGLRAGHRELELSEAKYRSFTELAVDAIFVVDRDGMILEVNRQASAITGVARRQLVGASMGTVLAPDRSNGSPFALDVPAEGAPILRAGRIVRPDGAMVDAELHSGALPDGLILCSCRDMTERKRAEESQREGDAFRKRVFESSRIAIVVMDATTLEFLDCNPAAVEIFGLASREGVLDKTPLDVSAPVQYDGTPSAEKARFQVAEALAEGTAVFEWRHQRPNGSIWDAEVHLMSFRSGRRELLQFTLQDITVRKRGALALQESEERYRRIAKCVPDLIWSLDLAGRFTYVNSAVERNMGWTAEEFLELTFRDVFTPEVALKVAAIIEEEYKNAAAPQYDRSTVTTFESVHLRKDGSSFSVEISGAFLWSDDGKPVGIIGTTRDITERKRAEEEKAKLQAQFHQAQKMESVGRLAGGVAHDFNNLLTVINGYSQMLLSKLSAGDPMRDDLGEIFKAGERAAGLTRQLLAFSRKQILDPRSMDVNRVVEEMRPMLERLVGEDVEVRVALQPNVGTILADPHQLEQVVMNLVVNSRDAMPGGGKLLVETATVEFEENSMQSHPDARVGRYVMLAVSDTGVGMDEETKSRIFEPFFTTKGIGKGTGLGLSMVQGVVAQSGGYVAVYSEKGHGTTFKSYLPALAKAAADTERQAAVPVLGGTETVLVVEDQAEVRKYAVKVLEAYGYRVIPAGNADEALLLWERERIDLVLTDLVMPNLSGRELADRLETLQPGIKVMFMSGYTDNVVVHQGALDEGAHLIQKPFSSEDLAGKVRAMLGPPVLAASILVADDEAAVRGFLRNVLEQGGYEVVEAVDGKQALQQVRAGHVDLVITDLIMPEQEGIETIQALRRDVPGVGIIAISGAFGGQFLKMAQMLGADAVLNKPVSPELLLATVAGVLGLRR
ncbi:MAG: PAS domain S-box protein [Candidatus Solibacter sp.]|nr:PAS domain S-box protein [Candidatus Solibacter sp.]